MKCITITQELLATQPVLIDVRTPEAFVDGFIKGSLYLSPFHDFDTWCQHFVAKDAPMVLIGTATQTSTASLRLTALGYSNLLGWTDSDTNTWIESGLPFDLIISVDAYELAIDIPNDPNLIVIDVSDLATYDANHVADAQHIPLRDFTNLAQVAALPEHSNLYIYCDDGVKSATACSILKIHGYQNMRWVTGGMNLMKGQTGLGFSKTPKQKPAKPGADEA